MMSAATNSNTVAYHDVPKGKRVSSALPAETGNSDRVANVTGGKPDKQLYEAAQLKLRAEIDVLQAKMSAIRDKISLATKSGPGNDRRSTLRAELEGIRENQVLSKSSRSKILDQIKVLQDAMQKKNKDIQAAKSKIPFKTVGEVDSRIQHLEKQVESATLKVAEEKRALQEISTHKRSRKVLEGFQADYDAIDKDKSRIEELRKELDDPVAKALSDRYDTIKAELDELKKESDDLYAGRTKLFEERDNIQNELDSLFTEKRESSQHYREANDRYWNRINEERARRAERQRLQRAAEEAQKKKEIAERLLEEAQIPAYQAQIEDCQTLVDLFSGKTTTAVILKSDLTAKAELAGVPKLEVRKVEEIPEGLVPIKKKGKEEEAYFIGRKSKAKPKKTPKTNDNGSQVASGPPSSSSFNAPLPILTALLSLSIPPPASSADVTRVIEDLKTKKAWLEANQKQQTEENVAKARAQIKKLDTKSSTNGVTGAGPGSDHAAETTPVAETIVDGSETVEGQGGEC